MSPASRPTAGPGPAAVGGAPEGPLAPAAADPCHRPCRTPGCTGELVSGFERKYRICTACTHASRLVVDGAVVRWCQQCARFQPPAEFDVGRRACRYSLRRHRQRRKDLLERRKQEAAAPSAPAAPAPAQGGAPRKRQRRQAAGGAGPGLEPAQQQLAQLRLQPHPRARKQAATGPRQPGRPAARAAAGPPPAGSAAAGRPERRSRAHALLQAPAALPAPPQQAARPGQAEGLQPDTPPHLPSAAAAAPSAPPAPALAPPPTKPAAAVVVQHATWRLPGPNLPLAPPGSPALHASLASPLPPLSPLSLLATSPALGAHPLLSSAPLGPPPRLPPARSGSQAAPPLLAGCGAPAGQPLAAPLAAPAAWASLQPLNVWGVEPLEAPALQAPSLESLLGGPPSGSSALPEPGLAPHLISSAHGVLRAPSPCFDDLCDWLPFSDGWGALDAAPPALPRASTAPPPCPPTWRQPRPGSGSLPPSFG